MVASVRCMFSFLAVLLLFQLNCGVALGRPDSILVQILGSRYTGLVRLLEEANLLADLETEEHSEGVTIFAPSDHYLADNVSPTLLNFLSQPGNIEYLRKVLLHHIVPGKVSAKAWYPGETVRTLAGADARLYLEDGDLKVDGVVVKELGVLEAGDGVVHSINGFLVPQEVMDAAEAEAVESGRRELVELAAAVLTPGAAPAPGPSADAVNQVLAALEALGTYDTLLQLLEQYDLIGTLSDLVSSGQPVTIIAPDDQAFQGINTDNLDKAQVTEILLYHVIVGEYSYNDLAAVGSGGGSPAPSPSRRLLQTTSGTVNTLANQTITVRTVPDANGQPTVYLNDALIQSPNAVPATGGISVQGVESVLVPPSLAISPSPSPGAVTVAPPPPGTPAAPPPSAGSRLAVTSWVALALAAVAGIALAL